VLSHFVSGDRISPVRLPVLLLLLLLAVKAHAAAVGTVQFVSGQAELNGQPLTPNAALTVGSTLKTGADGFVHVRFIDAAFISLRPGSVLHINAYHYDPERPGENRVEFFLERGNLRSITGHSGQANKAGFMLNTPVAAIGIRGTDFVTLTDRLNTRVRVVSGAVVMRAGSCSGRASGCWSGNDPLLSANDAHYLEVQQGRQPVLKNLIDLPSDSPLRTGGQEPVGGGDILEDSGNNTIPLEHNNLELAEFNGEPELDWGRWRASDTLEQPGTPLVSEQYTLGKEMVASTTTFGLMRTTAADPLRYWPSGTTLGLNLSASEAYLREGTRLYPARVDQGILTLDFNRNRFATQLSGTESQGNTQWQLQGGGEITAKGLLKGTPNAAVSLQGALSSEGHQAGYLFSLPLGPQRTVEGATLWSR
jgi:hypothetical protein